MSNLYVKYEVIADDSGVSELARKIAIEQSVECPESLITANIEKDYVGEIQHIESISHGKHVITLAYPEDVLSKQYNQLLNLCFGNVSMYQDVR